MTKRKKKPHRVPRKARKPVKKPDYASMSPEAASLAAAVNPDTPISPMGALKQLQIKVHDNINRLVHALEQGKGKVLDDNYAALELNVEETKKMREAMMKAFNWTESMEGKEFWHYVYKRLLGMENS